MPLSKYDTVNILKTGNPNKLHLSLVIHRPRCEWLISAAPLRNVSLRRPLLCSIFCWGYANHFIFKTVSAQEAPRAEWHGRCGSAAAEATQTALTRITATKHSLEPLPSSEAMAYDWWPINLSWLSWCTQRCRLYIQCMFSTQDSGGFSYTASMDLQVFPQCT